MRRIALACAVCASVLALPASAPAKGSTDKVAASACAKERKAIGRQAFTKKYGEKRSMQSCIRRSRGKVAAAQRQAEQDCADELAEIGFAEFAEDYGSDESGSDAMANCIAETVDFILDPGEESDEDEDDV